MTVLSAMARTIGVVMFAVMVVGVSSNALLAHCDTMDGPVIQDARTALEVKDVTPVLKWVQPKDEKVVKQAFAKAVAAKGGKGQEQAEKKFFESLVKVHRAGEGAPFTGLKPAGTVEPVIAEADKALAAGTPDGVVRMVTDAVAGGIRQRYERVAQAMKHKDESVQKGREFVAAYVEYTHYVERLQMDAAKSAAHHGEDEHKGHDRHRGTASKHDHGHAH